MHLAVDLLSDWSSICRLVNGHRNEGTTEEGDWQEELK